MCNEEHILLTIFHSRNRWSCCANISSNPSLLITHENIFVADRVNMLTKTGWPERAELFWEEKVAGVPAAWGKGGERRLPGGSEPDEKGLKPCRAVWALPGRLEGAPERF